MNTQFVKLHDSIINLANITFITKETIILSNEEENTNITVHFVGERQAKQFWTSKPDGKALLDWWERVVPDLTSVTQVESTKYMFGG